MRNKCKTIPMISWTELEKPVILFCCTKFPQVFGRHEMVSKVRDSAFEPTLRLNRRVLLRIQNIIPTALASFSAQNK